MLARENLYSFMEDNFDYLLVIDEKRRIIHTSRLFREDLMPEDGNGMDEILDDVVTPASNKTFLSAMTQARNHGRGIAEWCPEGSEETTLNLKAGFVDNGEGGIYLFFGNRQEDLGRIAGWEKNERIKELACIYNVMELIEVSTTIDEFFTKLPRILSGGMLHPEEVVIYSVYQGKEYGQKPFSKKYLSVKLVAGHQERGEIRAGYHDDDHKLLPEEQKMLDEIGRVLKLALERRDLRDRMKQMEEEEQAYRTRLDELKEEISSRTEELEQQKKNLAIVNSYFDRVNRGWEEAKGRLETMFRAIPDEVVLIDKGRKIVMTNREEVQQGEYCFKAFFNREKPCEDCRLARILRDKTPVTLTMKKDDKYYQVHALPVYNQLHEVDGILEFYRDITLEKTYDLQLQQADKLASLGQIVSGIGHEINNPNQFIRGNIKIVKQALGDMLPLIDEYQKDHTELKVANLDYSFFREHIMTLVDDMSHGSERIKNIVEGLRKFARKDDGLLVDMVDINTLIESSTRLVHNEVHKHAEIKLDLAHGLPPFLGNAQKIEQVLVNLIVNASQAMPEDRKGLIKIRTRMDEESVLVVEVDDNGSGMSPKIMKQIFDPFFTTKRAKGGTGLGLAIAYRIIEELQGTISVSSKPGEGTKFTIRIPVRSDAAALVKEK